jgi:L-threonylcarbamoyladenylate synthase
MNDIKIAADLISNGSLVAFPTETVYGLGADATNEAAVRQIYALKGRPSNNPLIVHVDDIMQANEIAVFNRDAEMLADVFWPGPLTLVLPLRKDGKLAPSVTAGLTTVAIRLPSHKTARALIQAAGRPIAAPSANPSGYVSPTSSSHVRSHFADLYILEGNNSEYGLESTIIDLSSNKPKILRYGFITPEALSEVLGVEVDYVTDIAIKAPGMMEKHYAPRAKIRLNANVLEGGEEGIGFGVIDLGDLNLSSSAKLEEAAANLYNMIQILDSKNNVTNIAIAPIPNIGIGLAINDRLKRAIA